MDGIIIEELRSLCGGQPTHPCRTSLSTLRLPRVVLVQAASKSRHQRYNKSHVLNYDLFDVLILHLNIPAPADDDHRFHVTFPPLQGCYFPHLQCSALLAAQHHLHLKISVLPVASGDAPIITELDTACTNFPVSFSFPHMSEMFLSIPTPHPRSHTQFTCIPALPDQVHAHTCTTIAPAHHSIHPHQHPSRAAHGSPDSRRANPGSARLGARPTLPTAVLTRISMHLSTAAQRALYRAPRVFCRRR
ncbi:hypothetical protein EDB86DRAFT_145485 [Lactarius hatsudake]|nr:hypothetical protein EDB86DRAFT_145485 [Lactarius hatsudake]